jgi:hypothetical protein
MSSLTWHPSSVASGGSLVAHLGASAWKRLKVVPRCGNHGDEIQASRGVGKTWLRATLVLGLRVGWPCLKLPKTHTWSGARSVSKIGCLGDCRPSAQWHKGGENSLGGRLLDHASVRSKPLANPDWACDRAYDRASNRDTWHACRPGTRHSVLNHAVPGMHRR